MRQKPINVEITEVQEEGRKRGDEYREVGEAAPDPVENWRARAAAIPDALDKAIKKKIGKKYAIKPILLIYLNISTYGLMQKETEAAIAKLKAKHKDAFLEICVLWQSKLY